MVITLAPTSHRMIDKERQENLKIAQDTVEKKKVAWRGIYSRIQEEE